MASLPPLLRLPLELQSDILFYIPFIDQISIAQTCSALRRLILSLRSLRYTSVPPTENDDPPYQEIVADAKLHILLASTIDDSTGGALLLHNIASGDIKEHLYLAFEGKFGTGRPKGVIWDGEDPPAEEMHEHLDFNDIWEPKLEVDELPRWVMCPIGNNAFVMLRGMVNISNSPFLDEPCLLYPSDGTGEDSRQGEVEFKVGPAFLDENGSLDEPPDSYNTFKATRDLTVRDLLDRMIRTSSMAVAKVMDVPPSEVLNACTTTCQYTVEGTWATSAVVLRTPAEVWDRFWVRIPSRDHSYVIMTKEVLEMMKALKG
ncbi:hypothetical protein TWF281_007668 [Arthrobotrys megalospora]